MILNYSINLVEDRMSADSQQWTTYKTVDNGQHNDITEILLKMALNAHVIITMFFGYFF
jgi:hypothetical protein